MVSKQNWISGLLENSPHFQTTKLKGVGGFTAAALKGEARGKEADFQMLLNVTH